MTIYKTLIFYVLEIKNQVIPNTSLPLIYIYIYIYIFRLINIILTKGILKLFIYSKGYRAKSGQNIAFYVVTYLDYL